MQINKNSVVSLTYTLTLENGEIVDTASKDYPFVFIHGIGATLPHFDSNLSNLKAGDEFNFDLSAENAYGFSNPEFKVPIPRSVFSGENVPEDVVQVGNMVPMQDNHGNPLNGIILSFDDNEVLIDFNHPLADKALNFKGEILSIREATAEEIAHGHVHGEGGHQH